MTDSPALTSPEKKLDDWLSPILVKELRQGMRARAFVISFILLQVFLVVLVLGNLAAQENRNALNEQDYYFWVIVGFALLVLMPLRGLNAIAQEVRRNTLETILLTRMTAWRLVFGKWSALFAQSLLFVTAVLPYVVLRYFIGGDDVVADFEWLFVLLWLSGMLIAASIAASSMVNVVIRVIIIILGLWLGGVMSGDIFGYGAHRFAFWQIVGWMALVGIFAPTLLFEFSATSIAPQSENHAIRRRGLALLFFLGALVLDWVTGSANSSWMMFPLGVFMFVCFFELSEKPLLIPRLLQPLERLGWTGRILGLFLLPGWPSALLFSLIFLPLSVLSFSPLFAGSGTTSRLELPLSICAVLGSVLVPVTICHLLWKSMKQVFLVVVLYNLAMFGVASLVEGFATLTQSGLDFALAFIPSLPVQIISLNDHAKSLSTRSWLEVNCLVLTLLLLLLFNASRAYFRNLFAIFRASATHSAANPSSPSPQP